MNKRWGNCQSILVTSQIDLFDPLWGDNDKEVK